MIVGLGCFGMEAKVGMGMNDFSLAIEAKAASNK